MNDKDAKNAGRAYRLGRAFADGRRYSRRQLAEDASNKMSERAREVWRRNGAKLFAYLLGPNA